MDEQENPKNCVLMILNLLHESQVSISLMLKYYKISIKYAEQISLLS